MNKYFILFVKVSGIALLCCVLLATCTPALANPSLTVLQEASQ